MTRGTTRHVDHLLLVAEPYFKSMETARRYHHLATDLGIPAVEVVGNKLRPGDEGIVEAFCEANDFTYAATIPHDDAFLEAERLGVAPIDHRPEAPGVRAIVELARRLVPGD